MAGSFISALSRLLTFYLQMHGFTCGFDDLLLVPEAEQQRRVMLETAETAALHASARFVGEEVPQLLEGGKDSGSPLRQSLVPVSGFTVTILINEAMRMKTLAYSIPCNSSVILPGLNRLHGGRPSPSLIVTQHDCVSPLVVQATPYMNGRPILHKQGCCAG